jgi:hypothetical protein
MTEITAFDTLRETHELAVLQARVEAIRSILTGI